MNDAQAFRPGVRQGLKEAVARLGNALGGAEDDLLRIDLHCHDRNSDVPDETLGRLLRLPETWLPTDRLAATLRSNGAHALTVTNHNNARSCWELLAKGEDVLPGAEFSCTLPDFGVGVHVLTFGFTPEQEETLNRLRRDIYRFLEFTADRDIPTVLAHPLHVYSPKGQPPLELMDRFAVLFERFEGVNGQRDAWQNLLTLSWIDGLDEEGVRAAARRTGLRPDAFCRRPFRKAATGGSDCHMGIFAGSTGTLLRAPGWREGRRSRADAALEALRRGDSAPYGSHCEEEKLTVAFLDYFCQVALRMEDPGLLRLMLHRGAPAEKLQALLIANGMLELRRHRYTTRFLALFHECLQGRKPSWFTTLMTSRAYRPLLSDMVAIAEARKAGAESLVPVLGEALPRMFGRLSSLLADRAIARTRALEERGVRLGGGDLLARFELPVHLRPLIGGAGKEASRGRGEPGGFDLGKWSDGLPFPALASAVLGGAAFAASRVLYSHRPFLEAFADRIGRHRHSRRVLWITDTLADRNGVSHALQAMLAEVRRRDLPIDFLACAPSGGAPGLEAGPHLRLIPSMAEFRLPAYRDQDIRLPGLLELQRIFLEGGYDRIVCSTEAPMGLFALYLKQAFNVPAYFYAHTDWMDFARRTLRFDPRQLDRLRRILRAFYRGFDGVFLLNSEQREYFASPDMGLKAERLFLTAHWADARFRPAEPVRMDRPESVRQDRPESGRASRSAALPGVAPGEKILLFAGRLSEEKGVMELPEILRRVRARVPDARLAFAGTGPCRERLQAAVSDALFLGWLDADRLAAAYHAADLLLLPSWFDTFSCSLLESLACGLPAVAFRTKGPRDILADGRGGLLADTTAEMGELAAELLTHPERLASLRTAARRRAQDFRPVPILDALLRDLDISDRGAAASSAPADRRENDPVAEEPILRALLALMET